jgi:hypothetical protein
MKPDPGERYREQAEAWEDERKREAWETPTRKALDAFEDAKEAHPIARWTLFAVALAGLCGLLARTLSHC